MKKVAIITSVFNGRDFIRGFFEDITKQTMFDECELVMDVVDNCSYTMSVIEEYLDVVNLKRVPPDEDRGVYHAWNSMISRSTAKYITNANVDDRLYPSCIEKHVKILEKFQNIDVAYCVNAVSTVPNSTYVDVSATTPNFYTAPFSFENLLKANLPHNHPVWRRSLHDRFGMFSTDYVSGSDWDFWLRCAQGGSLMMLIPEVLGVYYNNPEGVSTKLENMQRNLAEVEKIRSHFTRK